MRPLYFSLKVLIFQSIHLFFRKKKLVNPRKEFNAQTIFVVNHASAFMDPWVVAELQNPVLFFLTRGDIFKPWLKPITWASHMIPIFRTKENGADSAEKNEIIFQEVYRLLKKKKSIMIFGEGYTDDVFIRSLKPLKKGPARIGFGAMVSTNWELDIKIQCVGINYADPDAFRSDVLVSNSETIHLKDYKAGYLENPSKTINDLTKKITQLLRDQLTYLENAKLTPLHNHIQSITKQGIAHDNNDRSIPLEKRWRYSQSLAHFINENYDAEDNKWLDLEQDLSSYFGLLEQEKMKDKWIAKLQKKETLIDPLSYLYLLLGLPIFLVGAFHFILPYLGLKRFVERKFKRRVFWSGIKMILGQLIFAIYNIVLLFSLNAFLNLAENWMIWIYIIVVVPFLGLFAYNYYHKFLAIKSKLGLDKPLVEQLIQTRVELQERIFTIVKLG